MKLEHTDIKPSNESNKTKKKNFIIEIKEFLDLSYEFRKNTLTLEVEYRELPNGNFTNLDDMIVNSIWLDLQMEGFKCSVQVLTRILNSKLIPAYNPIKEYFDNLPTPDGTDYIQQLADTITISNLEIEDIQLKSLWKSYLQKWLVASAATCMGVGINHTCLILVGNQGSGKTTWLNKLCPTNMKNHLVCSHINPSLTDKNTANFLAEKWFVNIDDQLETIFGKDFNSMKAIITAPFVTNRKVWHRYSHTRRRVCSFMGSVNEPKFLTDIQNRRYLVFSTEHIDYSHTIDMNKVWARAKQLVEQKYPYWFSSQEMETLNKVNDIYRCPTVEEEWLSKLYKPCKPTDSNAKFLMPSEMLTYLNLHSGMKLSMRKLSRALKLLGYGEPISKRIKDVGIRKVYSVIQLTEFEQQEMQQKYKNEFNS